MRLEGWGALSFPAVKGQPRMHPDTFVAQYPEGRFLVKTARHLSAVIDGAWHDTIMRDDTRCIYRSWRLPDDWTPA